MFYILIALVCLTGLYISLGVIFEKENYRIVTRRRELVEELNELRRKAWREELFVEVRSNIEVAGVSFSFDDIGFGEEHVLAGLEENIQNGKQDEELRHIVSDEILRKTVWQFFVFKWPYVFGCLSGYRVMIKYFEEYVKVTYPRHLRLASTRKKMLENRQFV